MDLTGPQPEAPWIPSATFDIRRARAVYFGGWACDGQAPTSELWTLDLAGASDVSWTFHDRSHAPPGRNGAAAAYDESGDRMIVFGGDTGDIHGFSASNDVWELDLSTLSWSQVLASGEAPPPRWFASAIVDPAANDLVVFGGWPGSGDLYRLDLDTSNWRRVDPGGLAPPPVERHTAVYDGVTHSMIVFGGLLLYGAGDASRSESWVLDLNSDTWEQITFAGIVPTGRWGHSCVNADGRCIFFGGVHTTEVGNYYACMTADWLDNVFALQYVE